MVVKIVFLLKMQIICLRENIVGFQGASVITTRSHVVQYGLLRPLKLHGLLNMPSILALLLQSKHA